MSIFRRSFIKKFVGVSALALTLGSTSAFAAPNSHAKRNFDRLNAGLAELAEGAVAAAQNNRFKAKIQLRRAYYKLKIAEISLRHGRGNHAAVAAIGVALEKISPRSGLSVREQYQWGIDCVTEAIVAVVTRNFNGKVAANKLINVGKKLLNICYFDQAARALEAAQSKLYGRGVHGAVEALGIAIAKITDPYLTEQEKLFWGNDCIGVAKSFI